LNLVKRFIRGVFTGVVGVAKESLTLASGDDDEHELKHSKKNHKV
jgi:hypothetical protein